MMRLSASVQEVASIAEAYNFSLSGPCNRTAPEDLCQSEPLGLPPIEDRLDDVRCHACERQESADVGVRDTLLVRKVGDRLPSSPDLPTGTVAAVPASHRRGPGALPLASANGLVDVPGTQARSSRSFAAMIQSSGASPRRKYNRIDCIAKGTVLRRRR
jgi:hypothetical protein